MHIQIRHQLENKAVVSGVQSPTIHNRFSFNKIGVHYPRPGVFYGYVIAILRDKLKVGRQFPG